MGENATLQTGKKFFPNLFFKLFQCKNRMGTHGTDPGDPFIGDTGAGVVCDQPPANQCQDGSTLRVFDASDPAILIETGYWRGGYASDLSRTVCAGAPDDTFRKVYRTVRDAQAILGGGSGMAPINAYLKAGVPVGIGVDGSASNDGSNLLAEARQALLLARLAVAPGIGTGPQMAARTALEMATRGGAAVLGRDDVGSLEVGKRADFAVLDLNKPHLIPSPNPVSTVVCAATGKDVDTVVVDGRIVVRGGKALTMDEDRILAEARERASRLYARAGIEIKPRWPVQ